METPLRNFLDRLASHNCKPKKTSNGYMALCPAHDDHNSSLSISEGEDRRVLVKCFACCTPEEICKALSLRVRDLFLHRPRRKTIEKTYDYSDEKGTLLFQVVRYKPKNFRQRRPDGKGGWTWSINGVRRVLYRLPDIIAAVKAGRTIFIVEGEKDVATAVGWELDATCCPMGAGKWRPEFSDVLRGANVVIIPDNDKAGRDHAESVATSLHNMAACVRISTLPTTKDLTEFSEKGGTKEELLHLLESTSAWDPKQPQTKSNTTKTTDYHLTDCGNAERFAADHCDMVRYCWDISTWYVWDGKRWKPDSGGRIHEPGPIITKRAKTTTRKILEDALKLNPEDAQRKRLLNWGSTSEREHGILAMLNLARSIDTIKVSLDELDADPFLFNVSNGTINLRTGELYPHSLTDLITKISNVSYIPGARFDLWDRFLLTACGDDPEQVAFLQRVIGYTLTGSVIEDKLFFLLGPGATGKSSFIGAIKNTLGRDYSVTAPFETFLHRKEAQSGPRPELVVLVGKLAVFSVEVESGRKLAEALIKQMTGGDTCSTRDLYSKPFEFKPTFKLFLVSNDPPLARADDNAIWRRIVEIPFTHIVPEAQQDKNLRQKLCTPEAATAILAWAVSGCLDYQREGLRIPTRAQGATEALRATMSPLHNFIEECCLLGSNYKTTTGELWTAYEKYCRANLEDQISKQAFGAQLEALGCERDRTNSARFWKGIRPLGSKEHLSVTKGDNFGINLPREKCLREFSPDLSPVVTPDDQLESQTSIKDPHHPPTLLDVPLRGRTRRVNFKEKEVGEL